MPESRHGLLVPHQSGLHRSGLISTAQLQQNLTPTPSHTMNNALYTTAELRQTELHYQQNQGEFYLMQKAGAAIAAYLQQQFTSPPSRPVLILAGPGNNGGDALAAASRLAQAGYQIDVVYCSASQDTSQAYHGAAALAWQTLLALTTPHTDTIKLQHVSAFAPEASTPDSPYCLIVDGLFGLGLRRAIQGQLAQLIHYCNQLSTDFGTPILALDLPSGIDSDTGAIACYAATETPAVIRASTTLSFLADKPGLHTADALDYTGELLIASLGLDAEDFPAASHFLLDQDYPYARPPARKNNSHKGDFGDVVILGGASGMQGAVLLAARAAKLAGSGRIFAGFLEQPPPFDPLYPEIMCRAAEQLDLQRAIVVIGPGLGQTQAARQLCARVFAEAKQVVVDADALNCLALDTDLQKIWHNCRGQTRLLTPHPLEAARLLGLSTRAVQSQRFAALAQLCQTYQANVILKGAGSLIAGPGSPCFINSSGDPLLASGGSGDILSGLCAALLAQGLGGLDAAKLACFVHGAAAEQLARQHPGWLACSSGELLSACREVLAQLLQPA